MVEAIYICRHGETEWSLSGQHTSVTDLPLTENGIRQSEALRDRLGKRPFDAVFVSPLKRALETCMIAGYSKEAVVDADLIEWNYGEYEGVTTAKIHQTDPSWSIFTHGAPGGESVEEVKKRSDRMLAKLKAIKGEVAIFSSGHISRALAARWLGLEISYGSSFILGTATLSILSYEHGVPAIKLWNSL